MNHRQREFIERNYEVSRLQFSLDFRELLREYNKTYKDIADVLCVSVPEVRKRVQSNNITYKEMVELITILGGTCRVLIVIPRP